MALKPRIELIYLAPGVRVIVAGHTGTVIRTVKHRNPFYKQRVAVLLDGDTKETQEYMDSVLVKG